MSNFVESVNFSNGWEAVKPIKGSVIPCQRSLHAGAVWKDRFFVFGGYDGQHRVNDLHAFYFKNNLWKVLSNTNAPSPRDRHVAVVYEDSFYIFGGFDGIARINDFFEYQIENDCWRPVPSQGSIPTPRHSHSAVVYRDSMYIFGGYDGGYRNDFYCYNFKTGIWQVIQSTDQAPRARYRGTCVVFGDSMILHGGHDGSTHLLDTYLFDFQTERWISLVTEGPSPTPRDSHSAVVWGQSMFIYGGSTGTAVGDFYQLKLDFRRVWSPVSNKFSGLTNKNDSRMNLNQEMDIEQVVVSPGPRFCHVGVVYGSSFYIFGGYDGSNRLNDFLRYPLFHLENSQNLVSSTLINDLQGFVNNKILSDVQFVVEGQVIFAHKILCLRCPYFYTLLTGEYMESKMESIPIEDVKHSIFLLIIEYIYTDHVTISLDTAMELFQVADKYGLERLKVLCEQEMLRAIDFDTAASIFLTADQFNAENLRSKCLEFILRNFDVISVTPAFEEMGRVNVDLIFEILKKR